MNLKNGKIKLIYLLILVVIIVTGVIFLITNILTKDKEEIEIAENKEPQVKNETIKPEENKNYHIEKYKGKKYYIIDDDYKEEYEIQNVDLEKFVSEEDRPFGKNEDFEGFEVQEVMTYDEYEEYCDKWDIEKNYSDEDLNYIAFSYMAEGAPSVKVRLAEVEYDKKTAKLYIWDNTNGVIDAISAYVIFIPTEEKVSKVQVQELHKLEEYKKMKEKPKHTPEITYKPIIYLYPEKETEVDVKLGYKDKVTVSYPKYTNGWKVLAKVGGDLVDLKTNRNLYSLYYESRSVVDFKVEKEGFIVKGKESSKFLEEKLAILGLSEKESEEFIIYWLPKLESNKYNYIRFATPEEINKNMPLEITPTPDNVIRVLMTFKGIDKPIEVIEQKLETPERTGFTAVEWGGTEIK